MAPTELKELKEQMKDLLEKGFIRPSLWIEEQRKDNNLQKGMKQAERVKKMKLGDRQVYLAIHRRDS
ncbi:hypothetical protein MTR67_039236 [Solanum verrucosum]|uniref:Uncharacterized protein n=1 Tax=Solanum verrucosum TaxID=315347 RepID=A0AAF0UHZ6_SOLVR|nr:hypothetical protein MTR67_039236 [Solanum verrucosum]